MVRLDGKTVLVTGGATGFGAASARIARELGARVAMAGRRVDRGRDAAGALGPDVLFIPADVSQERDVVRMLSAVQDRFGQLDVLINNAGMIHRVPLAQDDVAGWDTLMATNLRGVFLCCKHALPMLTATRGAIVNVSSVLAFAARPGGRSTAYDA